jgi:hypothetical protein
MLCLPYYACVLFSTKFMIKAEQDLPGTEGRGGRGWGKGAGVSNDPNNVCMYE